MADDDKLEEDELPELEDSLGGLNERYPVMDNSLGRNEFLLFMQHLQLGYINQLSAAKNLIQKLKNENVILHNRLQQQVTEEIRKNLENNLRDNNKLLHYLFEIQNLIANNKKFQERLQMQLNYQNIQNNTVTAPQNTLENEAEKARTYPYFSPFHYTLKP